MQEITTTLSTLDEGTEFHLPTSPNTWRVEEKRNDGRVRVHYVAPDGSDHDDHEWPGNMTVVPHAS